MYQTLYRKYRPSNFNEVVGQKIIVQTLKNAIKNETAKFMYVDNSLCTETKITKRRKT